MANFLTQIAAQIQQQPVGTELEARGDIDVTTYKILATDDLIITPGGTGALRASASGNARGNYAVDLQITRSVVTQVASGTTSLICSGANNTASGESSIVVGGATNIATNTYSLVVGGHNNTVSGARSTVVNGKFNNATAERSCVAGGQYNTAGGDECFVGGGIFNSASGLYSFIGGGGGNNANGAYAFMGGAGGGTINATASGCAIVGGQSNTIGASCTSCAVMGGNSQSITASTYSVICGGSSNSITSTSDYSSIAGGNNNDIESSTYGVISGGMLNDVINGSDYSNVLGGYQNDIDGATYASIIGGRENDVTGNYAVASGYYAVAPNIAEIAHGSGRHDSTNGSAQKSEFVCFNSTSDATQTTLFTDGSTGVMTLTPNSCWCYNALVVGQKTDGSVGVGWEVKGVVKRDGAANAVLVGAVTATVLGDDSGGTYLATADVNTTRLRIRVTGVAATSINWTAHVRIAQVIVES